MNRRSQRNVKGILFGVLRDLLFKTTRLEPVNAKYCRSAPNVDSLRWQTMTMKLYAIMLFAAFFVGCAAPQPEQRMPNLPKEISDFPVRTGMSASQVEQILHISSIDSAYPFIFLRGPFVDNPWSGFYMIEFQDDTVSKVTFHWGNLSVVLHSWTLSER